MSNQRANTSIGHATIRVTPAAPKAYSKGLLSFPSLGVIQNSCAPGTWDGCWSRAWGWQMSGLALFIAVGRIYCNNTGGEGSLTGAEVCSGALELPLGSGLDPDLSLPALFAFPFLTLLPLSVCPCPGKWDAHWDDPAPTAWFIGKKCLEKTYVSWLERECLEDRSTDFQEESKIGLREQKKTF